MNHFRKRLKDKSRIKQFLKFFLFGSASYFLSLSLVFLLKEMLRFHYLTAWFIAWIISNLISFFFNNKYTFNDSSSQQTFVKLLKYYAVNLTSFLFTLALMYFFVEILKVYYLTATIFISVILLGYNFILHRNWSFK
jgi:putative flippase GtrA